MIHSNKAGFLDYRNNNIYNFNPNAYISNDDFVESVVVKAYC